MIASGEADAAFGSRMLTPGGALRGGMPRWKYVANRVLTLFENILLGAKLSEYHSGYRAFARPLLDAMAWLGLDYDEGPYYQMQRMDRYRAVAAEMVERVIASVRVFTKGAPQSDDITVMVITYNEEANIALVVERALEVLPTYVDEFEIVVVNDGSKDNTGPLLDAIVSRHAWFCRGL